MSSSAAVSAVVRRHLSHMSSTSSDSDSHFLHWHYSEFDDRNFQIHGQTLFYLFILFSIILIVTLLLLYARWYFRFRHLHSAPTMQLPTHPPQRGAQACRGLDAALINAMPIILHQDNAVEMECCICLGVFEEGDKVKVLTKCEHRFHSDCVDRWLGTQSSCPLCRVSLRVDLLPNSSCLDSV